MEQPAGLLSVLLDSGAPVADRDDAAMDLGDYDESEVLAALLQVGSNADESERVLESVGESIAEILLRSGRSWCPEIEDLTRTARQEFDGRVRANTS
jgi:hypothetical protein